MATSDRKPYESATDLTQDLLDQMQDNLLYRMEMVAEIEAPDGSTIRVSDRNKYIVDGGTGYFYEARTQFPVIDRTVGEWLSETLEFSGLELSINNTDQKYSDYLPAGSDYESWIGNEVIVKVGLAELGSSYKEIFKGFVTDVGGFSRDTSTFTLICRNQFDTVNQSFPLQSLITDDFPDLEEDFIGLASPVIYGDWTTGLRSEAPEVPAFPVNSANAGVQAGTSVLGLNISSTPLTYFDNATVTLFRGDNYYVFPSGDIVTYPGLDYQYFEIKQSGSGGTLSVDGSPFVYATGDQFYVKVKGIDLGTDDDNIVAQAKDILKRFGGLSDSDFDSNWATFAARTTPTESAIANWKSRVWVQEPKTAMEYANSMLEQVRLEIFVSRDNLFKLNSLQFTDLESSPSYEVRNWDIVRGSFSPVIDERNNWNRARGDYAFDPSIGENRWATAYYKNSDAITKIGKTISKIVVFPNLYIESDVVTNLEEMLKLASAYAEYIEVKLTPRSILKDIGDFVDMQVSIGSVDFSGTNVTPCMFRSIGYDPDGINLPVKFWSFQMVPFDGYNPGYNGITGGSTATITKDT